MSRVAWGASIEAQQRRVDAELGTGWKKTILRQTTLDVTNGNQKPQPGAPPESGALGVALGAKEGVYSRGAVTNWANLRFENDVNGDKQSMHRSATTEFDLALLSPFFGIPPSNSPILPANETNDNPAAASQPPQATATQNQLLGQDVRSIFRGCVFYLNSCDSDPLISTYLLEKIIRVMGGITVMGLSSKVTYVVCQHLCSAKLAQVRPASSVAGASLGKRRGSVAGSATSSSSGADRYIHPHYILLCARVGVRLPHAPFRTMTSPEASNSILALFGSGTHHQQRQSSGPLVFATHAAVVVAAQRHLATMEKPEQAQPITSIKPRAERGGVPSRKHKVNDDDDDDVEIIVGVKRPRSELPVLVDLLDVASQENLADPRPLKHPQRIELVTKHAATPPPTIAVVTNSSALLQQPSIIEPSSALEADDDEESLLLTSQPAQPTANPQTSSSPPQAVAATPQPMGDESEDEDKIIFP